MRGRGDADGGIICLFEYIPAPPPGPPPPSPATDFEAMLKLLDEADADNKRRQAELDVLTSQTMSETS